MTKYRLRLLAIFSAVLLAVFTIQFLLDLNESDPPNITSQNEDYIPSESGYMVYFDPTTGRIVDRPSNQALALSPEMQNALSTSSDGLVEEPAPGGGFIVNLQGRFQQATTTQLKHDKNHINCQTLHPTASPEQKQVSKGGN